ncbi:MAG: OsmC family protein [Bacteroidetes bacterium]|nr:OsmC family protein [Bacteroidota bacterium]MCY4204469.1 OsmC family protein [Bacteroidota bacterium]
MAKVTLQRLDDKFHFLAANSNGNTLHLDTGPEEGGSGQGVGPMQAVAMALGGCSGIDIVIVLKKQRQDLQKFDTIITYDRAEHETPSLFTKLHVHYEFEGQLDQDKVRRAVDLSINKYCSVAKILEKTATITVSWSINGQHYSLEPTN